MTPGAQTTRNIAYLKVVAFGMIISERSECTILHIFFQKFPRGSMPPTP